MLVCARIRPSSQSLVFKIYALSLLSFIRSVAEPDAASIVVETLALQRLSAGLFHSLPSAQLWCSSASASGLKIYVYGIQLTSKTARFRVA